MLLYHFNEEIEKWSSKIYYLIALCLLAILMITIFNYIPNTIFRYVQDILGGLMFYFIFLGFSRTSLSDRLNSSRFYGFCESHSMNIYLLNCPFMQIYFILLYPIIGTNILLTILCLLILSYPSIFIAVWVQDRLKKALIQTIPVFN